MNGENYVNALKNLKKFETPDSSVNRDTQRSISRGESVKIENLARDRS